MYNPLVIVGYTTVSYMVMSLAFIVLCIAAIRLVAIKKGRLNSEPAFDTTIVFFIAGVCFLGIGLTIQAGVLYWLPLAWLCACITALPTVLVVIVLIRHRLSG